MSEYKNYDSYKEWINGARKRGFEWDQIKYANLHNEAELSQFLAMQCKMNFWEPISIVDWYSLVDLQREEEQKVCAEEKKLSDGFDELYLQKFNKLKALEVAIKRFPTKEGISDYIKELIRLNIELKRQDTHLLQVERFRDSLCFSSRGFALALHSEKDETGYAMSIIEALLSEFDDMPSWTKKLIEDVTALRRQLLLKEPKGNSDKKQKKRASLSGWLVAVLICVALAAFIAGCEVDDQSAKATATPQPTATPKPMAVYNGKVLISTDYEQVCPFEISVDSNDDYYIYLRYQHAPEESFIDRTLKQMAAFPYESDMAFYVKAGQKVTIEVPVGVYKLYYAVGDTFFNTSLLFGDKTNCYSADELLDFYVGKPDINGYYSVKGHEITLKLLYDGNFDTEPISRINFPKR